MVKERRSTVRSPRSYKRAPDEKARLFAGLENLVNLGFSYEEFCKFASQWPTFCPMLLRKSSGALIPLFPHKRLHELVLRFRDFLTLVWRRDPLSHREQVLKILLGLAYAPVGSEALPGDKEEPEWVKADTSSTEALAESQRNRDNAREAIGREDEERRSIKVLSDFDPAIRRAVWALMHDRQTGYCRPSRPTIIADWERGELCYEPANDFQRAVYTLFCQSWRARFCRECQRMFIAEHHPQMYCGLSCSATARRKRDLKLWKSSGSMLRRRRAQRQRERKPRK
jgi:hypothetical protein